MNLICISELKWLRWYKTKMPKLNVNTHAYDQAALYLLKSMQRFCSNTSCIDLQCHSEMGITSWMSHRVLHDCEVIFTEFSLSQKMRNNFPKSTCSPRVNTVFLPFALHACEQIWGQSEACWEQTSVCRCHEHIWTSINSRSGQVILCCCCFFFNNAALTEHPLCKAAIKSAGILQIMRCESLAQDAFH